MTGDKLRQKSEIDSISSHRNLEVWKNGMQIVDSIYAIVHSFPAIEKYILVSQMMRAAISIPANIAEGAARRHSREFHQFCSIATGSCAELETLLIVAKRRNYIIEEQFILIQNLVQSEIRMLTAMMKKLRQRYES